MTENTFYTRFAERRLTEALEDSPVALIHGPRQCGKTTLALMACAPERLTSGGRPFRAPPSSSPSHAYVTFDDAVTRESAEADPMGFVADLPERVIMDEVQAGSRALCGAEVGGGPPSGGGPIPPDGFEQRAPSPCAVGLAGGAHGDGAAASVGAVRTPGFLDIARLPRRPVRMQF